MEETVSEPHSPKVAILLTGFWRSFGKTQENLRAVADGLDATVFAVTWDSDEWNTSKGVYRQNITADMFPKWIQHTRIESLESYANNRVSFRQNPRANDVMITSKRAQEHGEFWANRLRDQWYLVRRGWDLITSTGIKYDLVFRCRMDIAFSQFHSYMLGLVGPYIEIPQDIGGWNYTDHMALGGWDVMTKYCTFYDNMQACYDTDNVDPTHAVDFPKHYITKYGKSVTVIVNQDIKYEIVKP
jgi:hypothetical protein